MGSKTKREVSTHAELEPKRKRVKSDPGDEHITQSPFKVEGMNDETTAKQESGQIVTTNINNPVVIEISDDDDDVKQEEEAVDDVEEAIPPIISEDGSLSSTSTTLYCKACNLWFGNLWKWIKHCKNEMHIKLVGKVGPNGDGRPAIRNTSNTVSVSCQVCAVKVRLDQWVNHYRSQEHCERLRLFAKSTNSKKCKCCKKCGIYVRHRDWKSHLQSKRHQSSESLHEFLGYQIKKNRRYSKSKAGISKGSSSRTNSSRVSVKKVSAPLAITEVCRNRISDKRTPLVIDLDNGDDADEIVDSEPEILNPITSKNEEVVVEGSDQENSSASESKEVLKDEMELVSNEVFSGESLRCLTDLISTDGWVKVTKQGLLCVPCGRWYSKLIFLLGHFSGGRHKKKADKYKASGRGCPPHENQNENWYGSCLPCKKPMRVDEWVDHFKHSEHRKLFEDFQQEALPADDYFRCTYCLKFVEKSEWSAHENTVSHQANRVVHDFVASRKSLARSCTENANLGESCSEKRSEASISIEMAEEDRTNEANVDECLVENNVMSVHSDEEANETRHTKNESLDECASVDATGQFVFCKPCGRWLQSISYWRRHSAGETHKKELLCHGPNGNGLQRPDVPEAYKRAQMLKCDLCAIQCLKGKWSAHTASKKHRTKAERFLETPLPNPSEYRRCRSCAVDVRLYSWKQHLADRVHKLNAKKKQS